MLTVGVLALPVDVRGRQLMDVRRTASSRAQRGRESGPGVTAGVGRGLMVMLEGDVLRLGLGAMVVLLLLLPSSLSRCRCRCRCTGTSGTSMGAAVQVQV
jgi:hypothetical protein